MTILVTGANGFLGSHIVEHLYNQGKEVKCLVRPSADLTHLKSLRSIEIIKGDYSDLSSLKRAISNVDRIIHCAGLTMAIDHQDLYSVNVGTTERLLECAASYAPQLQRFVFISGLAAVGPSLDEKPISSDRLFSPQPISHYGQSKQIAESKVESYSNTFPVTIVRPAIIYGPRDIRTLIFFKSVKRGIIPLLLQGKGNYSIVHVRDVADAICKATLAAHTKSSLYYIDGGKSYSLQEFYACIKSAISPRWCCSIPVPSFLLTPLAFVIEQLYRFQESKIPFTRDKVKELKQLNWICESLKTQRELNWYPQISLSEGIQQTYEWYKNAGWLK